MSTDGDGVTTVRCDICGERFLDEDELGEHLIASHGGVSAEQAQPDEEGK